MLALELAVCGCGNSSSHCDSKYANHRKLGGLSHSAVPTQASLLNFVVSFNVTNSGPLDFNSSPASLLQSGGLLCNGTNERRNTERDGHAEHRMAGIVTGTFTMNIDFRTTNGNAMALTGTLTGNSNGTTTTTGNLTNGVVVGPWTLTGAAGDPSCSVPSGTFVMCQNPTGGTCPAPVT